MAPPQHPNYYNTRSSRWTCSTGWWICWIYTTIYFIMFVFMVTAIVLTLVFKPNDIKVYVNNASLTQFYLTDENTTLHYNLTMDMSIRNPSKKVGVYYDRLEFKAHFRGKRFSLVKLPTFYQKPKNTTSLHPSFTGQQEIKLGSKDLKEFSTQRDRGVFMVEVKMPLKIRNNYNGLRIKYKPDVYCKFWAALVTNGSLGNGFSRSRCGVDYHDDAGA